MSRGNETSRDDRWISLAATLFQVQPAIAAQGLLASACGRWAGGHGVCSSSGVGLQPHWVVEQTPHQPSRRSAEVGRNALADPDGRGSSAGRWPDQGAAALVVGDVCILIGCAQRNPLRTKQCQGECISKRPSQASPLRCALNWRWSSVESGPVDGGGMRVRTTNS